MSTHSKESLALSAAIANSGMTKAAIALQIGVTAANVSQWATGRRPVPVAHAEQLATLLDVKPESVCAAYAKLVANGSAISVRADVRPDLEISRLQNDVHALNIALGALVVTMVKHRPAEARDVAQDLRRTVPKKFQDSGLLRVLLSTLDRAADRPV